MINFKYLILYNCEIKKDLIIYDCSIEENINSHETFRIINVLYSGQSPLEKFFMGAACVINICLLDDKL